MVSGTVKHNPRVQLSLRLDERLRSQIEAAASHTLRSMNAEIVFRLKASLAQTADEAPRSSP